MELIEIITSDLVLFVLVLTMLFNAVILLIRSRGIPDVVLAIIWILLIVSLIIVETIEVSIGVTFVVRLTAVIIAAVTTITNVLSLLKQNGNSE